MRVLLVAYDYPPTQSPRALRWRYLTRELALLGHEVHVLVPDLGEPNVELPQTPGRVVVHRTFPGPFGWLIGRAGRRRERPANSPVHPATESGTRLNWRGRLMDIAKRIAGLALFPDVRAEWNPWARHALRRLLPDLKPDVVVTSHEPASTLLLGAYAQRHGFAWVADLGDPVCAAYTPERWRRRAMALEARVSTLADYVLVTNEATRALLIQRHGQDARRCAVLPNGYDDRRIPAEHLWDRPSFDDKRLELVYAGRLYGYRDPAPLLQAVATTPGVRLTLVVPDPPEGDASATLMEGAGDRLRPLGPLPHDQVQAMLERADVLVNFGDRGQPVRIAAKVYEYLGIARPILHVHSGEGDAAAALLRGLGRGWLCAADAGELAALLADLVQRKRDGRLHQGLASLEPVYDFAHSNLGRRLAADLAEAAGVPLPVASASGSEPANPASGSSPGAADTGNDPAHARPCHTKTVPETAPDESPTDALERELAARRAQVRQLKAEVRERNSEIAILNQRLEWMDAQIRELHASTSWRVTAPLRSLARSVRQLDGKVRYGRGKKPVTVSAEAPVRASVLEGEDTFVLYRIIGNDLPPRHRRGQAIANLRFILEHEPALAGCEKRFVLNRIRDRDQEREIIDLLDRHGIGYLRIPFEAEAYARAGFDTDILPAADFLAGGQVKALDQAQHDRLLAAIYRHKNNYAMNNNGARNVALADGRGRAKWILPWDGNCYLTADAWQQIRADIESAPQNRYFIVPMARMLDNEPLIHGGDIPKAAEEPQVIFRTDAGEQFNPAFCYGRRPKVELLWRLGVSGPWDDYSDDPWDQPRRPRSPEAGLVGTAGWVARLFSGEGTLEAHSDHSTLHRGVARTGAIMAALQHLDARIAGADPEQPVSIDTGTLAEEAGRRDHSPLGRLIDALLLAADEARSRWEGTAEGTLEDALADPVILSLAHACTGARPYARAAAGVIQRVFVAPARLSGPDPAHTGFPAHAGGAGMRGLHGLLDAVRMLERADALREPAKTGFRAWLMARLQWLLESQQGLAACAAGNHVGTWYDLEVATIAAFLDDHETIYHALIRAQARIGGQFAADGRQPAELSGTDTASACCLNLQGWVYLSELAGRWGVDLWGHRPRSGGGLPDGARWLLSHIGKPWPYRQAGGFDADRFHPLRFAVPGCADSPCAGVDDSPYRFKPVFPSWSGVRPFWNLAGPRKRLSAS